MSNQNWETPWEVFNALHAEFNFTLDGAADPTNTKLPNFLSDWAGYINANEYIAGSSDVIFCNPPYANMDSWIATFIDWSMTGAIVVALHLPSISPVWFAHLWATASEYRLVYPRIQFLGTQSSNTRDSVITVWRPYCMKKEAREPKVTRWSWL